MAEVGMLLRGPPSEVWARSLRQETALQDHYRRSIHHGDSGVANVGFDRWNAACCLQEQVDSARGVEHTRRLVKSRAIAARFTRRSVMKDLQGTELQTTFTKANSTCGGLSVEDGSLTRSQALEKFGIDLGRVGVMTSARTASRHSLIDGGSGSGQGTARGGDSQRVAIATNSSSDVGGIGRGEAERRTNKTEIKRGRGGCSDMTTVKGDSNISRKGVVARRQELMSKKMDVLDKLLCDEFLGQLPEDEDRETKGKATKASTQSEEDDSILVSSRTNTGNKTTVNAFVDKGGESHLDTLPAQEAPSCKMLAEETACGSADSQTLVPEPQKAKTVADIQTPDEGGRRCVADVREAVLQENATVKEVIQLERSRRYKEALPNHRPCWWWASLLPPDVEGICIPDMVLSAPTAYPSCCNKAGTGTESTDVVSPNQNNALRMTSSSPVTGSRTNTATNAPAVSPTNQPCTKNSSQQSLLWAFSTFAKHEDGDGGDANPSTRAAPPNPRYGVTSLVEGEGCGGGPAKAYPSTKKSSRAGKLSFSKENSSPVQHPPVQQKIHTKVIDGKEGILCATRAICECGKRGGGGTGSEGGSSELKLPLALLKVWGHEGDEERRRNNLRGKLGTPCRGRRLRVVSLWTQTEVLGALRDMARGKWLRRGEQPEQVSGSFGSDQDACCVQAFTKGARFSEAASFHLFTSPFNTGNAMKPPQSFLTVPRKSEGATFGAEGAGVGGDGFVDGKSKRITSDGGDIDPRVVGGVNQGRHERGAAAPTKDNSLSAPVFYRTAWRRTGEKLFVWKITSRYPYVSSLSAHFCPLVRVGSAVPFTASQAEEGAVAMATAKMENLAKVLRRAYDPTLQQLWADWAVNEGDERWLLIEIHGIRTDADIHSAAAARAVPPAFAQVESKVYRSIHHTPSKNFCGDPDDLQARLAAANPTQELSLVEISKRAVAAASTHHPSRPPTPSNVAASTKKALLAKRGAVSEQETSRRKCSGARQMRNQYWRCAGDFCETHSAGQRWKSPSHGKVNHDPETTSSTVERQSAGGAKMDNNSGTAKCWGTGVAGEEGRGGGAGRGDGRDYEVEDIIGRRKHALAVETPRTVLFRLVLNARAALLEWRPSAFDFSQMEKPVQLCSACFMVCSTLERERIETTRRAMDAAAQAAKEGKARRNRRPPGWKSRLQHELEESLDADRYVVSRLIDSFETTSAATAEAKKKRPPSSSASSSIRDKNHLRSRQKGSGGTTDGGGSVTWADRCPLAEVSLDEEKDRADVSAQFTPRGMVSAPAAGQTLMVASTRKTKTAPLAPASGLKRLSPVQQATLTKTTSILGAGAKREPEEKAKKREIRARRKAKERARRRLRNSVTDDASARSVSVRGKPSGKKGNDIGFSGGKTGGTENTDDHKRDTEHELPTILWPTAPTSLPSKAAPDIGLTSDVHLVETSGQLRQLANSTTLENKLGEEEGHAGGEEPSCTISDYGITQPQLLQPIASRENWGGEKVMAQERPGDSEEIGCISVDREESNSEYGDDGFEDDAT